MYSNVSAATRPRKPSWKTLVRLLGFVEGSHNPRQVGRRPAIQDLAQPSHRLGQGEGE